MFSLLIALQVATVQPMPAFSPVVQPSGRIAKIIHKRDGRTKASAFKVKNVGEEYEILRTFGLKPDVQSLVIDDDRRAFDMLTAIDPNTGAKVELWFDISSFYGKDIF